MPSTRWRKPKRLRSRTRACTSSPVQRRVVARLILTQRVSDSFESSTCILVAWISRPFAFRISYRDSPEPLAPASFSREQDLVAVTRLEVVADTSTDDLSPLGLVRLEASPNGRPTADARFPSFRRSSLCSRS